jgi:phospholipid/cholesterol/gamma-HCH transport system substrate-binding protein
MSAPTNHWKLGLFVVGSVVLGLMGIVFLAGRALQEKTVRYTSFFDEAVTGLNTGSPVSYRGVSLGNVAEINIAPDRRHVEISYDLGVAELERLGLVKRGERLSLPPDIRVQLGSSGVTGTKFLQIDFFNPKTHPPPQVPFRLPRNYIPATASTFKSLEDSVISAVDQFPALARQVDKVLTQINTLLTEIRAQKLPEQASGTLADADAVINLLHKKLEQVPMSELTGEARGALQGVARTLARAEALLEQMNSDTGVLRSVQRASDGVGDMAGNATGVVSDVGATLRDLRETIDAVRSLAEALERDSDMLIKGRARKAE